MSINSRQLAFLKTQGYTGSVNDAYRAYLLSLLGVTTGAIDDLLYTYLKSRWGYTGSLNDMLVAHLRYLGYTGSINDMLYAAWGAAGIAGHSFAASLKTTVVPEYAAGSKAVTYTRATTATVVDHESIVRPVISGEVRFQGARRVRNFIQGSSENLTNASYTKDAGGTGVAPTVTAAYADGPVAGMTASRVQFNRGAGTTGSDFSRVFQNTGTSGNVQHVFWAKSNTSSSYVLSCFANGANQLFTVTTSWQRFAFQSPTGNSYWWIATYGNDASSTTADVLITGAQQEGVIGQSNQAPGEYVSVGVLSSPFHGAMVDGVKYFDTTNGNSVSSNVVTEASGSAISSSTLLGYLAEGARTNLCLQSQDLATTWTTSNVTVSTNQTTAPDGTNTADAIFEAATTSTHFLNQSITISASTTYSYSIFVKGINRSWCVVEMIGVDAAGRYAYFNLSGAGSVGTTSGTTSTSIKAYPNGWYLCTIVAASGTGAGTGAARVYSAPADNTVTFLGVITNGVYAWGAQLEAGSFASSYIPTTTASVTRNADVLTYPFAGNASASVGSAYAELSTQWTTGPTTPTAAIQFGSSGQILVSGGQVSTAFRVYDGTNVVDKTGLSDMALGIRKRVSSWGSSLMMTGDGLTVASGSFDGAMSSTAIGIGVNPDTSTAQWYGTIKNVRIYSTQLTSAQLQAVTA